MSARSRLDWPAAFLGATAYILAPYFVSLVFPRRDGKIFVTALPPLLFWAVERHFSTPKLETVSAIALVVGVVLDTTHVQMAYFRFGAAIFRSFQHWHAAKSPIKEESQPGQQLRQAATRFGMFLAAANDGSRDRCGSVRSGG